MEIQRVSSNSPWETRYAYCRAIRVADLVVLGGTAPVADDGSTFAPGDAHAQTLRCYEIIETALRELDLDKTAIIRVRLYVTDIAQSHEFGTAHKQFFDGHIPCMTMVEVSRLIEPDMLVEIEVDATALPSRS